MSKIICLVTALGAAAMLSGGCTSYQPSVGFASSNSGLLYTQMTFPSKLQDESLDPAKHTFLGEVKGESFNSNILGVAAFGDGGIMAAEKNALNHFKDADGIVNAKIDTEVFSILYLFSRVTTRIHGFAVKYKSIK